MVESNWAVAWKGIDARRAIHVSRTRSRAEAADTIRDPCWQCPEVLGGLTREYEPGGMRITG